MNVATLSHCTLQAQESNPRARKRANKAGGAGEDAESEADDHAEADDKHDDEDQYQDHDQDQAADANL